MTPAQDLARMRRRHMWWWSSDLRLWISRCGLVRIAAPEKPVQAPELERCRACARFARYLGLL